MTGVRVRVREELRQRGSSRPQTVTAGCTSPWIEKRRDVAVAPSPPLTSLWLEAEGGDVILTGRVTDCLAGGVGGMFWGLAGVYFDLKVTDAASGELLLGAHHFIEGATAESIQTRYTAWVRTFARVVAERTLPPRQPAPLKPLQPLPVGTAIPMVAPRGPVGSIESSAADLEAALRRLAALRRDGLINEEEFQTLRRQALEKAKVSAK